MATRCRWPPEELVRVGAEPARRLDDAGLVEQFAGTIPSGTARQALTVAQHGGNLRADAEKRVERGLRLLKDDRHGASADSIELAAIQAQQLPPLEAGAARNDRAVRQQAERGEHGDALARAGLADERRGLAGRHREIEAADRFDRSETNRKPVEHQQRAHSAAFAARRIASPS